MRHRTTTGLVLVFSLLAGCATPQSDDHRDDSGPKAPPVATASAEEDSTPPAYVAKTAPKTDLGFASEPELEAIAKEVASEPTRAPGAHHAAAESIPSASSLLVDVCGKDFGPPRMLAAWKDRLGSTHSIVRQGYVLLHSDVDKVPLWVCEHVTKAAVSGELKRPKPEPFKADPQLKQGERAELADYRGSGFDRGHMAPSGNQTVDQRLQAETYYLSNMVPQVGKTFNQGIWKALEEQVRHWAQARGETYTITGPIFWNEDSAAAEFETIGQNKVVVPTHCFKIVVAKKPGSTKWEALAFVLPNTTFPKPWKLERYLTSIRSVEQHTGFDFLSNLPKDVQDELETQTANALWN
jgi:endonuclease G